MTARLVTVVALTSLMGAICPGKADDAEGKSLVVDPKRMEISLAAVVQKTSEPRMSDWASAAPALLGSRGGGYESFFVFVAEAKVPDIYRALLDLGARPRVVYPLKDVAQHVGLRPDNTPADYLQGDPVQIYVKWQTPEGEQRMAYEDFFLEKVTVGGQETIKPWTPHFVFHGSGVLNKKETGCIACTHDCPGGIIGNNQFPLVDPIPTLKADWSKLPKPGTRVTVILRPVPSRPCRLPVE